jgi:hypothetical protein
MLRPSIDDSSSPLSGRSAAAGGHSPLHVPTRDEREHSKIRYRGYGCVAGNICMTEGTTNVAGIAIPSIDPIFLAVVGVHILLGLACIVTGAIAMLSQKRAGRHPWYGTIYFWCLAGVFVTSTGLAATRWAEDYHLFVLGALSFAAAYFGRQARRQRWRNWVRLHITGMGTSYVLLVIAFYVDNGKQLPVWKELPHFTYWLLPLAVGIPLIVRALLWHPLARQTSSRLST